MNGVRSTYMRKGYLLTALAAAVLLAASSGTASAQSVGWNMSTGSVSEGSSDAANTPAQLVVKILRSGTPPQGTSVDDYFGTITVQGLGATGVDATISVSTMPGSGNVSDQGAITWVNNEATMVINGDTDDNWMDETVTLKLQSSEAGVTPSPGTLRISVMDTDVQPVARFSKGSISLTEDSSTNVSVRVGVESTVADDIPAALAAITAGNIRVMITPADAIYDATSNPDGPLEVMVGTAALEASAAPNNQAGTYDIAAIQDIVTATTDGRRLMGGTELTITARTDMDGFTNPMVSIAFDATSLRTADGMIMGGAALNIDVQSDEPAPTLSFSPTDVTIDEGGSTETVLLAEGTHGAEVRMVKLMVEGDAMVSLMHDGETLEEMDGHVYVDLGDSNAARLMAMSHSDPDLMDGDTAYKAWKLVEGGTDGAEIGAGYWFRVDVTGSTAVPALPLIGQLLLALFLMAGGARFYRRRQG